MISTSATFTAKRASEAIMCGGVSVITRELPDELIERHNLQSSIVSRSPDADREVHFLHRERFPRLPVWLNGELVILQWGNNNSRSRLPSTGWCRMDSLESGTWQHLNPEPVDILANFGFDRGIWYQITEGVRGVVVRDERGTEHVYMLTLPSTHYYEIMTRNERMPVFINQTI